MKHTAWSHPPTTLGLRSGTRRTVGDLSAPVWTNHRFRQLWNARYAPQPDQHRCGEPDCLKVRHRERAIRPLISFAIEEIDLLEPVEPLRPYFTVKPASTGSVTPVT